MPSDAHAMVFLGNTGLNDVSAETLSSLTFSPATDDRAITEFDTVVVQTDTGAYYNLGNLSVADVSVTADYAPIQ